MYAKIDSWHKADALVTRCGLEIPTGAPTSETLPLNEKSCESCLRLAEHDVENPDSDTGDQDPDPAE